MVSKWKDGFLAMPAAVFRVKGSCCLPDNLKWFNTSLQLSDEKGLGKKIVIVESKLWIYGNHSLLLLIFSI